MTTEYDWEALKDLVSEALEMEPAERRRFVESKRVPAALAREAMTLIEAAAVEPDATSSFVLDRRADAFVGQHVATTPSDMTGRTLGKFRLVRAVGRGGMGVVYLAEQLDLDREVAVKVFPPHALGFDSRMRFEREVHALSRLSHPGIARIYDAGLFTDPNVPGFAPVPFFAMEYVDGVPITEHCRAHALTLPDKIALLADVADAVHAAHQRALVHRDIKPGNVLVMPPTDGHPHGSPKVLDFGIARMIRDDAVDRTLMTDQGLVLGTLGYMAPEQARGDSEEIDVRTDVYALGVLLHEITTGQPMHRLEGVPLTEALRRLSDPAPASFRVEDDFTGGDLKTVAQTAVDPDKSRRYGSAAALADDLRRLLRCETIAARPATTAYRARKFVRRHRVGVVAGSLAIAGLLGGMLVASVALVREKDARDLAETRRVAAETAADEANTQRELAETAAEIAERQRRRARASSDFLTHIVWSAEPGEIGRDVTVVEAVRAALPSIDSYARGDAAAESDLRLVVGQTFRNLGYPEEAYDAFETAATLAAEAFGESSPQAMWAEIERADALTVAGQVAEARAILDEQEAIYEAALPTADWTDLERDALRLGLDFAQASLLAEEGVYEPSIELFGRSLATAEARPELTDPYNLDNARANYAITLTYAGLLPEAEAAQRALASDRAQRLGTNHPRTLIVRQNLAGTLIEMGEFDEAKQILDEVIAEGTAQWGPQHPSTLSSRNGLATLEFTRGDYEAAARIAGEVLDDGRAVFPQSEPFLLFPANTRAVSLASLGRWDEAVPQMRWLVEHGERIYGPEHPYTLSLRAGLANALGETGAMAAAVAELKDVLEIQRRVAGENAAGPIITENSIAMFQMRMGQPEAASQTLRVLVDRAVENDLNPLAALLRRNLGRALTQSGAFEQAEQALLRAYADALGVLSEPQQQRTADFTAELYEAWGKPDEAAIWRGKGTGAPQP